MPIIASYQMRAVLQYLDAAAASLPPSDPYFESVPAWNIRMARDLLYRTAIGDVEVELVERKEAA